MKHLLQRILFSVARMVLRRQRPDIIGITGSVGKTSAKDAIYTVLSKKHVVRRTYANYNNEIGVPLTIIGSDSAGKNIIRWGAIICKGLVFGLLPLRYPKVLVLEMGADHPGDIKYLTKLAPAYIGIVTTISDQPSHMEFFKDVEQLAREKNIMYKHLTKNDWAVINLDESRTRDMVEVVKAKPLTIAIDRPADLRAIEIQYSHNSRELVASPHITGLSFKLEYKGSIVPCFIPGAIGKPQVYAALLAAAVGTIYGMNLVEVTEAMKGYQSPKGRMNLIAGQQQSLLIDDSYNSSPAAVREALKVFSDIESTSKRIICLGNMEELGTQSKRAHTLIGKAIAGMEVDHLVTVGDKAQWISEAAEANGLPHEAIHHFETVSDAIETTRSLIQPHSVVLIKGSQSARMELLVKALMANPEQAKDLLVRQYGNWTTV